MKKILATVMAAVCVMSMTGCSGGGKFKSTTNKIQKSAINDADASEASKKQKKAMMSDSFDPSDDIFNDGCYYTLTSDEAKESTGGLDCVEEGDIKNAFIFVKSEEGSYVIAEVFELAEKEIAQDVYDEFLGTLEVDEKSLKKSAKNSDLEYGFGEDSDTSYSVLAISDEQNKASGIYLKLDGKVVIVAAYNGNADADIYTEYLDVMFNSKLEDMEGLL